MYALKRDIVPAAMKVNNRTFLNFVLGSVMR